MDAVTKLGRLTTYVVVALIIAIIYHKIRSLMGNPYPYSTFLFDRTDRWADFFGTVEFNKNFDPFHNTFRGYGTNYPPFSYVILEIFTVIPGLGVYLYALFCGAVLVFYSKFISVEISRVEGLDKKREKRLLRIALALCICAYPVLYAFDRMNAELLMFSLSVFALYFYCKGKWGPAAFFFGAAGAMKIYPLLLAIIFIYQKKYRQFIHSVLWFAGLTVGSFVVLRISPLEVLQVYRHWLPVYQSMMTGNTPLTHSNTLFALVRTIQILYNPSNLTNVELGLQTIRWYTPVSAGIAIVLLLASFSSRLKLYQRVLLLVTLILLVPVMSSDYKCIFLFIPLYFWLMDTTGGKTENYFVLGFFTLMFSPTAYGVWYADVTTSTMVHVLTLSVMAIYLVYLAWLSSPDSVET